MNTYVITPERAPLFAHLADRQTAEKIARGELLAIGAAADELSPPKAVGLLGCRLDEGTAELVWLYVEEEYRRQGYATAMLWKLLDSLVMERSLAEVIAVFSLSDSTLPFKELLEDIGFGEETAEAAGCYDSTVKELQAFPGLGAQVPGQLLSLKEVPDICLKLFNRSLAQSEAGDAAVLPIIPEDYHSASTVYIENNQIKGILLIRDGSDDEVSVSWLYAAPGNPKILPALLSRTVSNVLAAFPSETRLTFGVTNTASAALVKKLLPNAVRRRVCVMSLDLADGLDKEG